MRPARAPPSMLMLQMVIRCSIVSARMASPRYSKTWPVPPPMPIRAISARMMSLALTPGREPAVDPDLVGLRVALEQGLGGEDHLDLARPDPERERPERAVGARCASRRTRWSCPAGSGPSCGPMTWTMPWLGDADAVERDAELARSCVSSWSIWAAACGSSIGRLRGVVGIEWSAVATVCAGRRTRRPRSRSPVKACGLVTSWTRWRSTARTAGAPGSWVTTWSAQILSTMVRGLSMAAAASAGGSLRS